MRFQFLTIALFVACADARRAPPAPTKRPVAPFGVIQPMDAPKEQDMKKVKQVKLVRKPAFVSEKRAHEIMDAVDNMFE